MNQEIQNLEIAIEDAKHAIAMKDSLIKLEQNPDFQFLIKECYFKDEASNLVMSKAMPHLNNPEIQESIDNSIRGISELNQFFSRVFTAGSTAKRTLAADQKTHTEILAEDL